MDRHVIECPHCGGNHAEGTKFCPATGKTLLRYCRYCWSQNTLDATYCVNCGTRIADASLGIPITVFERWEEKFQQYGWKQSFDSLTQAHIKKISPPLDRTRENVLFSQRIGRDAWLIKAEIDDVAIESQARNDTAGSVTATNWRLIVLDFMQLRGLSFPYQLLSGAQLQKNQPGAFPIMRIELTNDHPLVLYRMKMPGFVNSPGIIARLITPPIITQAQDINTQLTNIELAHHIERARDDNSLLISFVEYIVTAKERLSQEQAVSQKVEVWQEFDEDVFSPAVVTQVGAYNLHDAALKLSDAERLYILLDAETSKELLDLTAFQLEYLKAQMLKPARADEGWFFPRNALQQFVTDEEFLTTEISKIDDQIKALEAESELGRNPKNDQKTAKLDEIAEILDAKADEIVELRDVMKDALGDYDAFEVVWKQK